MKKGWEQIFNAKGETLSQPGATPQEPRLRTYRGPKVRSQEVAVWSGFQPSNIFHPVTQGVALSRAMPFAILAPGRCPFGAQTAQPQSSKIFSAKGAPLSQPGATPQEPHPPTNRGPKVRSKERTVRPGLQPSILFHTVTQGVALPRALPFAILAPGRCPSGEL